MVVKSDGLRPFDLEQFLPYRLSRVAESVSADFAGDGRLDFEFNWAEWQVMWAVGEGLFSTAKDISGHSGLNKAKISRAVRTLEGRGWLGRRRDSDDRRLEHITLTEDGMAHYGAMVEAARAYERGLELVLDPAARKALAEGLADIGETIAAGPLSMVRSDLNDETL
ncbi:MAG: MarR family transcriptional regulator [Allorhizobium sp.]